MLRIILAYNFTPERLQMLKMVALLCKAQVKAVAREDMLSMKKPMPEEHSSKNV